MIRRIAHFETDAGPEPGNQVVLLGASNLTRALPTAIETARSVLGGPCRFLVAAGHGRSYGGRSLVLCRTLPGIVECGLWGALDRSSERRTVALLTDIGNDILYGHPAARILGWVRTCVERLEALGARIVVTDLPMENVRHVGRGRFLLLRTVFFPTSRLSLERVVREGRAISEGLGELEEAGRVQLVRQPNEWYGFDAVHIRRGCRAAAFGRMLGLWRESAVAGASTGAAAGTVAGEAREARPRVAPLGHRLRLRLLPPAQRRVCGIEQRRAQPIDRLKDGSTIRLY